MSKLAKLIWWSRLNLVPNIVKFEYIGGEGLFDKDNEEYFSDGLRVGEPLDKAALRRVEVKIQTAIRKKRPFSTVDAQTYKVNGGVCVSYVIRESADLRVDNIVIEGANQIPESEVIQGADLKASNWRWWKFSWLLSNGRLDPEDYKKDVTAITDFYRSRGFLDVKVEEKNPEKACVIKEIDKSKDNTSGKGWIDVVYRVNEGRRYTVGNVTISGNKLAETNKVFSTEALQKIVVEPSLRRGAYKPEVDHFIKGEAFSEVALNNAAEKIKEYYGQMGYLNANVDIQRKPNLKTGEIDVTFYRDGRHAFHSTFY
jgi:outer membrane protein insertion porin family